MEMELSEYNNLELTIEQLRDEVAALRISAKLLCDLFNEYDRLPTTANRQPLRHAVGQLEAAIK